jgi:hypothetical protein
MQYLVPMHPTVVSLNCFGTKVGTVTKASPPAAVSLRREVAASDLLVSFLLAAVRVATDVVIERFADVSCWTVVLSLVAVSAKLSNNPARASITSCAAGSMTRLATQLNGLSVTPAHWRLMPLAYAAR